MNIKSQIIKVEEAINNTSKSASGLKKVFSNISKSLGLSKLLSSFGRVAFYRLVRTIIKTITDAIQEGIENMYNYAKQVGGSFATTMDELATKSQTMKNQLGAAAAEIIEWLQPLLEKLIQFVTRFAELVTQFFAALNGKKTYTKAIDCAKEWKDTTEEGNEAAEE